MATVRGTGSVIIVLLIAVLALLRNDVWQTESGPWDDAARKNPSKGRIFTNLGVAYHHRNMLDEAIASYRRAIALSPASSLDAWSNIGAIYIDQGRYEQAVAVFTQLLSIDANDAFSYANRARAHEQAGRFEQALLDYGVAIGLLPRHAAFYFSRGDVHARRGNADGARSDFRTACALGLDAGCARMRE